MTGVQTCALPILDQNLPEISDAIKSGRPGEARTLDPMIKSHEDKKWQIAVNQIGVGIF